MQAAVPSRAEPTEQGQPQAASPRDGGTFPVEGSGEQAVPSPSAASPFPPQLLPPAPGDDPTLPHRSR